MRKYIPNIILSINIGYIPRIKFISVMYCSNMWGDCWWNPKGNILFSILIRSG